MNDGTELDRQLIWTDEGFTVPFSHMFVIPGAGGEAPMRLSTETQNNLKLGPAQEAP